MKKKIKKTNMGNQCLQYNKVNNNSNEISESNRTEDSRWCENNKFPVTKTEMVLLEESWKHVSPKWDQICSAAFARWFELYPEIAVLFGTTANNKEEIASTIKSPGILSHASRFQALIEKVLNQMNDIEKLSNTLKEYGKFHPGFGAEQKYANCLATSLKYGVCLVSECDIETANAWDSLFRYLAGMLKRGMRIAKAEGVKVQLRNHHEQIEETKNNSDGVFHSSEKGEHEKDSSIIQVEMAGK